MCSGLLLAALLAVNACSLAPPLVVPEQVEALPESYQQAPTDEAYEPVAWWRTYRDPVLNRLIEEVLEENLDLAEAVGRVEQVRAQYRIQRAGLFPNVQAELQGQRQSQPANTGLGGAFGGLGRGQGGGGDSGGGAGNGQNGDSAGDAGLRSGDGGPDGTGEAGGAQQQVPQQPDRFSFVTYSAALSFSYEVDFWGRVRNAVNAAEASFFASLADLHMVRLQVISETMRTYFEIVELEQLIDLTREELQLVQERVALGDRRYVRGLTSSFELYSIRQQFRQAQAQLPQLRSRIYDAEARLAVLTGGYVDSIDSLLATVDTLEVYLALEPIPAGLPSRLLERRPDVLAAYQRLEAARFDIGAARAERLPSLSLTGSFGVQSDALTSLLGYDQRYSSFMASLMAPIFAGGRLSAQVDAAEARYVQQASAYARTVITAFADVETALKNYQETRTRYLALRDRVESAGESAQVQRRRYTEGVGSFLDYLDARRNYVGSMSALVSAERAVANARLAVHRALGGAWVPLPEELADATTERE